MAKRKSKAKRSMRIRTIDLKKVKTEAGLRTALKKASRSKVAIIVFNAPFKLSAAATS